MRSVFFSFVLLALGCSTQSNPTLHFDSTWTLQPGVLIEVNLRIARGGAVSAMFDAQPQAVQWDVHNHSDAGVVVLKQGADQRIAFSFASPADGVYSVSFNLGQERSRSGVLNARIDGEAELVSVSYQ
jgi:hypothetical protein